MGALARLHAPAKFSHTKSSARGELRGMKGAAGGTSKAPPPRPAPALPYIGAAAGGRRSARQSVLCSPAGLIAPGGALTGTPVPPSLPAQQLQGGDAGAQPARGRFALPVRPPGGTSGSARRAGPFNAENAKKHPDQQISLRNAKTHSKTKKPPAKPVQN